jgi:hypothetical protein
MGAPEVIQELIQRVEGNRAMFRLGNTNEARLALN